MPFKTIITALWLAILFLPFKGPKSAGLLFMAVVLSMTAIRYLKSPAHRAMDAVRALGLPGIDSKPALLLIILIALGLPLVSSAYVMDIAVLILIYAILAMGLNIVVGYAGLLNLGFVAFYAIGAYAYAILSARLGLGFWAALPLATGMAAISGFLLGIPALRLRGDYFAIVTLGFGEIVHLTLNNWDSLTSGPNGIIGIPRPEILGRAVNGQSAFYYFTLFMSAVAIIVVNNVYRSKIGRAWCAIREDELAASTSGINTVAYKFYALSFGAFWAGLAGMLFASKMRFVSPESFTFIESVTVLCMVILGGLGSTTGAVAGAVILIGLPEVLRGMESYRMLLLGAGLVMLMIYKPQGFFGGVKDKGGKDASA